MGLPVASITVDLDSAYQYRHIHGLPQIGRGDDTPLTLGVETVGRETDLSPACSPQSPHNPNDPAAMYPDLFTLIPLRLV